MTNRQKLNRHMERFKRIMNVAGDLILLNLLMLLCCLPVVTAGASLVAGYVCILRVVRGQDEGLPLRSFFGAFGGAFRKTLPIWLLLLGCFAVLAADYYYAVYVCQPVNRFFLVFAIVMAVLIFCAAEWVFPLMARFDNTRGMYVQNAALMAVARFPKTLLALLFTAAWWGIPLYVPEFFLYAGWIWLAFGLSLPMYWTALLFQVELQCQRAQPEDKDQD